MTFHRLFVVGCPRSGTSLLQGLLSAHPELTGFSESHFFDKGFSLGPAGWRMRSRELARYFDGFVAENSLEGLRPELQAVRSAIEGEDVMGAAASFTALLDSAATARRVRGWVEKTPDHVFRTALIMKACPSARFVHIVRDGPSTIQSLRRATVAWGRPRSSLRAALHWSLAVLASRRAIGRAQHYVLMYRDLTSRPEETLRRLCAWLGMEWVPSIMDEYPREAARLASPGEDWKMRASESIEPRAEVEINALPFTARVVVMLAPWYWSLDRLSSPRSMFNGTG